ncbi:MAG: DUF1127 domain-containing protein [Pseudomonadota bacterium]
MAFVSHSAVVRPARRRHTLRALISLWRSRRALARLDSRALDDIGVTAGQAASEATRPIWDVPHHWRG